MRGEEESELRREETFNVSKEIEKAHIELEKVHNRKSLPRKALKLVLYYFIFLEVLTIIVLCYLLYLRDGALF